MCLHLAMRMFISIDKALFKQMCIVIAFCIRRFNMIDNKIKYHLPSKINLLFALLKYHYHILAKKTLFKCALFIYL